MKLFKIVKDYLTDEKIVQELEAWLDSDTLTRFALDLIRDYDLDADLRAKAKEIIDDMDVDELVEFIDDNTY